MQKTFIGPHLRRLRLERGETQGAMAQGAGDQPVLRQPLGEQRAIRLGARSCCGCSRPMASTGARSRRRTGRANWPTCAPPCRTRSSTPPAPTCRSFAQHWSTARTLRGAFLRLHRAYQSGDRPASGPSAKATGAEGASHRRLARRRPCTTVFRRHRNHFRDLEDAAERVLGPTPVETDEVYAAAQAPPARPSGIMVRLVPGRRPARHPAPAMTRRGARSCCRRRSITRTAPSSWSMSRA